MPCKVAKSLLKKETKMGYYRYYRFLSLLKKGHRKTYQKPFVGGRETLYNPSVTSASK